MATPKKYSQDILALSLSALNGLLCLLLVVVNLLRVGNGNSFVASYRQNLGIDAFSVAGYSSVISFILFSLVSLVAVIFLAVRFYSIKRSLAIGILLFGLFIQILCFLVSNALIALH